MDWNINVGLLIGIVGSIIQQLSTDFLAGQLKKVYDLCKLINPVDNQLSYLKNKVNKNFPTTLMFVECLATK